ncbi:phosphatase PAP2 family protein [Geodermatophilus sp. DSM 44513]|uniref:phosphatase PAP2 family protein n=1 Tax=Geodermatophilus sp. DSM 44513 TaxID=1528104 RepID=UPI001280FB7B|nr:phosphatase PAP2 family protein [Geodermatophilus sp. DSM 44513]WNV73637.1 phosphatase PAP2 family protein [Geodermatophilus sp. DSM 44513]
MTRDTGVRTPPPGAARTDATGVGRFGLRALLGWVALLAGAVPFLLLWLLVQRSWSPLGSLDGEVAAGLNEEVSGSPLLVSVLQGVTDLGGTGAAVLVMVLATVFLLVRGQRRLAAFVATTGIGLAVLGPVAKAVVDRARPVVASPVVETPSNASFPSGHAMTAVVVYGALLLVALPSVRRRARPWLVAATALLVVLVGLTRLALGVHFVSDVLAGWALGAGWLAVTAAAFRGWQHDRAGSVEEPLDPLDVPPAEAVHLAPAAGPVPTGGRTAALRLVAVAAGLFAALSVLGLLVTAVLTDTWIGRSDRSAVRWAADLRSPALTTVMETVSTLSGTRTVIAAGLALAVLGLAVAASWRPVVFVVVTLLGEVALYSLSSQVVSRARPAVADLTSGLPSAASWPSGHAAAAAALYGALAALVVVYARAPRRWPVLAVPLLLVVAIGASRVYVAAHHPTDVLAGAALGGVWVCACARWLLPAPGRGVRAGTAGVR